MSRVGSECRRARNFLTCIDELDAADRSILDMHLRRCGDCRELADRMLKLQARPEHGVEIDDERKHKIFDRLTPVVYEISERSRKNVAPSFSYRHAAFLGAGLAAAAIALALWMPDYDAASQSKAGAELTRLEPISKPNVSLEATVDRCEGEVLVGGRNAAAEPAMALGSGSKIELKSRSRFSFHIGDQVRIALFGEAEWSLNTVTEVYMEMRLDKGQLAAELDSGAGRILEIHTPAAVVRVIGTIFTVEALPDGRTRVGVVEGKVEVVPRSGPVETLEVGPDQVVTVPGFAPATTLTEQQREIAAEIQSIGEYPEDLTRMVRFEGSPEQVNVEVDGRVIGTAPLTVRLPEGPLSYRLTAPGMEPFTGEINGGSEMERISFSMVPSRDYAPAMERVDEDPSSTVKRLQAAPSKAGDQNGDWSLFERAKAAVTAGDIPYSIDLIERAMKSLTDDRLVVAMSLLAECHTAVGDYSKAANILDRLIEMSLDSTTAQNARYEVGRLSMDKLGDLPRARAAFTAYLASRIGGALREEAYYSLCELDSREGEHRQALHCFNEFIRAFPGGHYEPEARLWRGALYQDLERRWADAERDLLAFIKAKPGHRKAEEARYRVALGRYQVRDERGTLRMIDEYMREHPNGEYMLRVGRLKQALLNPGFSWEQDSK